MYFVGPHVGHGGGFEEGERDRQVQARAEGASQGAEEGVGVGGHAPGQPAGRRERGAPRRRAAHRVGRARPARRTQLRGQAARLAPQRRARRRRRHQLGRQRLHRQQDAARAAPLAARLRLPPGSMLMLESRQHRRCQSFAPTKVLANSSQNAHTEAPHFYHFMCSS